MKKLFSLLTALLFVGTMWGAEGDTHDFSQNFSQLLNNNASIASINIAAQSYPVKEVIVSYRYNNTVTDAVTIEVKVAGSSWGTFNVNGTGKNYNTESFSGDAATGAIKIDFTNNTGTGTGHGTFYVNNIQLVEGPSAAPAYTITAQSNNTDFGTVELNGSVITGSPKAGYRYADPAYTVTTGTATVVQGTGENINKFTVTPSTDCTVTINFEAIPTHKIHFNTNGVVDIDDATVAEGETYDITETPAASLGENCTYNTFVGWTLSSSIADANVKPALVTSVTMSTSDVTLYAVYSKTTGGGGSTDDSKTFTFSEIADENNWDNGTAYTPVVIDPVTIVANGGGNNGKWYTSGGGSWRMYSGGTVEITVEGGEVTAVTSSPSCTFEIDNNGVATFSPSARTDFTEITVDYTISGGGTTTYSLDAQCAAAGTCVTPSISPATGTYGVAQEVTITTATEGATIYYTTNGTTPSNTNGTEYTEPIAVSSNMTIKAIAVKDTYDDSEVAEATYTFKAATPTFSAEGATMSNGQFKTTLTVSLASTSTAAGAAIYYTLDGTDPSASSTLYDEPIEISATTTVKAIAIKTGWANSEIAEQEYVKFAVTNCATARIAALSVSANNELYNDGEEFTIRGYVTDVTKYESNNYFWINDEKGEYKMLEVYNPAQAEPVALAVGDYVEVTGNLTKYNTTPEFASGCTFWVVSPATAVDNVETSAKAVKVLKNGILLIEKANKTYNAQGQVVK